LSGQIVDATIVAALKQHNTIEEKKAIKEGRIPVGWEQNPAGLAQKNRDARWTVKYTKAKPQEDGSLPPVDLAIPAFGYKNYIAVNRTYGLICKWTTTHAAAHDGARLEDVLDRSNTASDIWADTAYRSAKNEEMLARQGFVSRIHRKKPKGRVMPERTRISNAQP
jgi:IS5 family transposase